MNGNCHFVYSASVSTALVLNLTEITNTFVNISPTPETATLFVLGGLIGGIFPDIDNPVSYIGKLSSPLSNAIGEVGKFTGNTESHHRGILHDPTVYIAGLLLCYLNFTPLVGFFLGCLSHLFLDLFNPSGIPFMLGRKRLRLMKIPSGSRESVIFTWINVGLVLMIGILWRVISPFLLN